METARSYTPQTQSSRSRRADPPGPGGLKSLAARAILPVSCAVAGFVGVCCILLYTTLKADRIEESIHHANDLSGVLVNSTRYAMLKDDREMLRNIVVDVGREDLVDHVRIFNKKGRIAFSGEETEVGRAVDEKAEGCSMCHAAALPVERLGPMEQARRYTKEGGERVLAVTEPIYNEPDCSSASCHYHDPGQVVLGTLDVGLSEAPLQRSLAATGRKLAVFAGLVLVLTVGGVAGLLHRTVIAPVQHLAARARRLVPGREGNPGGRVVDELEVLRQTVAILERGERLEDRVEPRAEPR